MSTSSGVAATGALSRWLLCIVIMTSAISAFRSLNQNPWLKYKSAVSDGEAGKRNHAGNKRTAMRASELMQVTN